MQPLLRLINLSKNFGTLVALSQVSLDVSPGEVVGLAGRSGSGKSVLVSVLAGLYAPGSGDVYFDGRRVSVFRPHAMRALGIEVIHQKADLAEDLDITSNIFLGSELGRTFGGQWLRLPDQKRMEREAIRILDRLGVQFGSPREKARNLSGEQRQIIAIARAMARPARLIVVDEPLVALSFSVNKTLLDLVQEWRQSGIAVIIASSSLDDLFAVTDRLAIFRDGQKVAERVTDATNREEVVALLVGSPEHEPITPIIWALDSYYHARQQAEELHHQRTLLERNLAAQDTLNKQLLMKLADQLNAMDSVNVALQVAQRRLMTEREQERKHLARELHDQIIQDLLSVSYSLEDIAGQLQIPGEAPLSAEMNDLRATIRELISDLRRICGDLRPPTIDSLGLSAAIQSYTRDWSDRIGIPVTLEMPSDLSRLPEDIELSVFRIVQEGLSNIRKHAGASCVAVCLKHTSPRTLLVSIADDGHGLPEGFDLSALSADGHYGLLGISERIALLGGRLKLQNQASGGLRLEVEIPHPRVEVPMSSIGG
jgi:signal transduction histidine kinase